MKKPQPMHDLKFKRTLLLLLLCISFSINAQSSSSVIEKLQSVIDIKSGREFIKNHPELKSKIYTYNQEKHTNELSKKLFALNEGETLLVEQKNDNALYKIITITPTKHYRASYIYLSAKNKETSEVLKLRQQLKSKLNSGQEFKDVAGQYSMDRNARKGGDLGWFQEKKMFSEFTNALDAHKTGDVFFLDLKTKQKFYLIKKTADSKDINLLTVLKVTLKHSVTIKE